MLRESEENDGEKKPRRRPDVQLPTGPRPELKLDSGPRGVREGACRKYGGFGGARHGYILRGMF